MSPVSGCSYCNCNPKSVVDFSSVALNLTSYADEVLAASAEHGVDAALIRAIIHAESAFNPNAVSRVGAQGLMQLMPATATRFGVTSAFDPADNIKGGVSYLAWLLKRFDGDERRVAAAYNAGEGAVDKYEGVPPYQETMVFVERVGQLRGRYHTAMAPQVAIAAETPQIATEDESIAAKSSSTLSFLAIQKQMYQTTTTTKTACRIPSTPAWITSMKSNPAPRITRPVLM